MARLPDYKLKALDKTNNETGEVGAAWLNKKDGSISIRLNMAVVLQQRQDLLITLFPRNVAKTVVTSNGVANES